VNIYLYEGARHRNVPMMLHALALGAEKDFSNEYDHKRTPLIQTLLSVCSIYVFFFDDRKGTAMTGLLDQ